MKIRFTGFLTLGVFCCLAATAQTSTPSLESFREDYNICPRVESFRMTEYGKLAPSLYTGAMSWSLPLYTYRDQDFCLPFSIDYHFDGFRPNLPTGTVGLGWALNCGGVITREVKGVEDEFQGMMISYSTWGDLPEENEYLLKGWYYNATEHPPLYWNREVLRSGQYSKYEYSPLYALQNGFQDETLLARDASTTTRFDLAPDVFSFSFFGYRGKFELTENGFVVYDSTAPEGEFEIEMTPFQRGDGKWTVSISVETGDGYKYIFGENELSQEFTWCDVASDEGAFNVDYTNVFRIGSQEPSHTTAWRLSRIIAPNGNSVEFTYFERFIIEPEISYSYSPKTETITPVSYQSTVSYRRKIFQGRYFHPLISVKVNGHTLAVLNWSGIQAGSNLDEHSSSNFENGALISDYFNQYAYQYWKIDNKRLGGISFYNSEQVCFEWWTFSNGIIGDATGARRRVLTSAESNSQGTYNFSYCRPPQGVSFPKHDSQEKDLWGYWKAGTFDPRLETVYDTLADEIDSLSCAVPDMAKTTTGALAQIQFPTGGTTNIEYEQNTACKVVDRGPVEQPSLVLLHTYNVPVGGIRVRKLTNESGDGMSDFVEYTYFDNYDDMRSVGPSSGIVTNVPRISLSLNYKRYYSAFGNFILCSGTGFPGIYMSLTSTLYMPMMPYAQREPSVCYSQVQEHYPDQSVINHVFSSYDDTPDIYPIGGTVQWTSDIEPYDDSDVVKMANIFAAPRLDKSMMRGVEVRTSSYKYDGAFIMSDEQNFFSERVAMRRNGIYDNKLSFWQTATQQLYAPRISASTSKNRYDSSGTGGFLSRRTNYGYNSLGRQDKIECIDCDGRTERLDIDYCGTSSATDAGQIKSAVSEMTRTVNGAVTSKVHFGYSGSSRNSCPSSIQEYIFDTPGQNPGLNDRMRTTFIAYDNKFRISRVSLPDGAYIAYVWDSGKQHIVSKEVNCAENVERYVWRDLIGLETVRYATGQSESYSYDSRNRLKYVLNTNNEIILQHSAALLSEPGATSNIIGLRTYTSSSRTSFFDDITFYNGLGYAKQSVLQSVGGDGENVVKPIVYDNMRRNDARDFKEFPFGSGIPSLVQDAVEKQKQWYQENYSDTCSYAVAKYEPASDRILSARKAGSVFKVTDKKIICEYHLNSLSDNVLRFEFIYPDGVSAAMVNCTGPAAAGTLSKTVRVNEDGDTTVVFGNYRDKTVLLRQLNNGETLDTYNVYDARDSLVCTIQPEGSARLGTISSFEFGDEFSTKYCFTWIYDGESRLIESSVPGAGCTSYAYDNRGRCVYCEDSNLKQVGKGKYYTYDSMDRLSEEGICTPYADIESIRSSIIYGAPLEYLFSNRIPYRQKRYYSASSTNIPSHLDFSPVPGVVSSADTCTSRCRTLVSYEIIWESPYYPDNTSIVTPPYYVERSFWYDAQGRVSQIVESDSDGWTARYSSKYDFVGNTVKYHELQTDWSNNSHTLLIQSTYDTRGRLCQYTKTVDGTDFPSVQYSFDALGRVKTRESKGLPGASNIVCENISYNLNGWISSISAYSSRHSMTLFTENLDYYDNPFSRRYSGNVGLASTTQCGQGTIATAYSYDHLSRLTGSANYTGSIPSYSGTIRNIRYDRNGNISQYDLNDGVSDCTTFLGYSGNRVQQGARVVQGQLDVEYFFSHDGNGNTTTLGDGRCSRYNLLNLPVSGAGVSYCYLSDGAKRECDIAAGAELIYRGLFVFVRNQDGGCSFESVGYRDGRVTSRNGQYRDEWFIKDHLENVRTVVDLKSTASADFILDQRDYLPFGGLIHNGNISDSSNRYRYGGKEYQATADEYDFGARYLDVSFPMWVSPDPMASKYLNISPYSYCAGNPVNYVDLDGKSAKYRVEFGSLFLGIKYKQETEQILRTASTSEALAYMDCSEFISRVLYADRITDTSTGMSTWTMRSFFADDSKFIKVKSPKKGDIVLMTKHVGMVYDVDEAKQTVSFIHASYSHEEIFIHTIDINKFESIFDQKIIGIYRPRHETPYPQLVSTSSISPSIVIAEKKKIDQIIQKAICNETLSIIRTSH